MIITFTINQHSQCKTITTTKIIKSAQFIKKTETSIYLPIPLPSWMCSILVAFVNNYIYKLNYVTIPILMMYETNEEKNLSRFTLSKTNLSEKKTMPYHFQFLKR